MPVFTRWNPGEPIAARRLNEMIDAISANTRRLARAPSDDENTEQLDIEEESGGGGIAAGAEGIFYGRVTAEANDTLTITLRPSLLSITAVKPEHTRGFIGEFLDATSGDQIGIWPRYALSSGPSVFPVTDEVLVLKVATGTIINFPNEEYIEISTRALVRVVDNIP